MLITTHSGSVVSSDHITCILMQKHRVGRDKTEGDPARPSHFKVLLCMANGLILVAVRELPEMAARFLRKEIATRWAEGAPELHISEALHRYEEGAYVAQDIRTKLILIEGGD
jgi:hypothetical protein